MCATCLMRCALSIERCALCIVRCALCKKNCTFASSHNRGAPHAGAENKPLSPDPDNAGEGRFYSIF